MRKFFLALALSTISSQAWGFLGGFEKDDGYITVFINSSWFAGTNPQTSGPTPDYDVSKYNAGQFGLNVNPSSPGNYINNPSGIGGLWQKTQGALMASNVLPGFSSPGSPNLASYATSHNLSPGSSPPIKPLAGSQAFVVTTNTVGWGGIPQTYDYKLDSLDLGGMIPSSTGNQTLKVSFYSCASISGTGEGFPYGGGLGAGTIGHITSFLDGFNKVGVEVGYIQPGTTQDFAAIRVGGGSWINTGVAVQRDGWHRWDLELDLATDKVSIDLTPVTTFQHSATPGPLAFGSTSTLASGASMINAMSSLEKLQFTSTPGVNNSKVWALDNFEFCITEASLSDLISGGTLWSGDKQFTDFSYHPIGDMPAAEDVYVKAITDDDGNVGIQFQGAFVDAAGGSVSDALIEYTVSAPNGRLIKDVHMEANPFIVGGSNAKGLVSVTETFLADNVDTVLSVFDSKPGSRQLTDWADLVDANGNLKPVQTLHVQKDIIAWSQQLGSTATMSFINQTFSQCDADSMNPGTCRTGGPIPIMAPAPDFNGDGIVDAADYSVWRDGFGTKYTNNDYSAWLAAFGASMDGGVTSVRSIPEPQTLSLLLGILGVSICARLKL